MISVDEFLNGSPAAEAFAPGRVNMLGEHTDYNDGFVLPIATPQRTYIALGYSPDEKCHLYSATLDQSISYSRKGIIPEGFGSYIEGCMRMVDECGVDVPALNVYIHSDVPMGAGLSSSAALEVAMLRALRSLLDADFDDVALAKMAQQAEIRFAKVKCGLMDQMASSIADSEHMLFLDIRTLERRLLPLPPDTELVVIDSGIPRKLAASKYNDRRLECEEAARLLGVPSLRDTPDLAAVERLPDPYRKRARHVFTENERVKEAGTGVTGERFGALMDASHASLRDDFEVSITQLDLLTALMRDHSDVFGARLTGAGFGGSCVALCRKWRAHEVSKWVLSQYSELGQRGRILLPEPVRSS
jgi:galactokinase